MSYPKTAYVLKWYPRFSETFIVNELLAHEAANKGVSIFALNHPPDSHFQDGISRVRAPVTYLPEQRPSARELWEVLVFAQRAGLDVFDAIRADSGIEVHLIYQAIVLATLVLERQIEHLHAHFARDATTVARYAAKMCKISYSFTTHARDIFHSDVDHNDLRAKIKDSAAVVAVTDFNKNYLSNLFPDLSDKLKRVNYGLDLKRLRYAPRKGGRTIVAVGRFVEKKGFEELLRACDVLKRQQVHFSCTIIGYGPLANRLLELRRNFNLVEEVVFLGALPHREVVKVVKQASMLVAPCVEAGDGDRDGMPNTLLEAMALGTPCLTTRVVGIPEFVIAGETGSVVEPDNAEALAEEIANLLDDTVLQMRLTASARDFVQEHCDSRITSARLRDIFRECK